MLDASTHMHDYRCSCRHRRRATNILARRHSPVLREKRQPVSSLEMCVCVRKKPNT